ncbi:MAG: hypothetical protein RR022_07430 [Angelakisella sp.]
MNAITLRNKTYPILFDLTAVAQIQQRYGDIAKVTEAMQNTEEICWLLSLIINEGQKLQALEYGAPSHPLSQDDVATLLTLQDMNSPQLIASIVDAFNECLGAEKNLTAGQLTAVGQMILTNQSTLPG